MSEGKGLVDNLISKAGPVRPVLEAGVASSDEHATSEGSAAGDRVDEAPEKARPSAPIAMTPSDRDRARAGGEVATLFRRCRTTIATDLWLPWCMVPR